MKLLLKRAHGTVGYTEGELLINGKFFCHTLEDQERKEKIAGATAIPKGVYKVVINRSTRFKRLMPLLLSVPNFTGIRIHAGNTAASTEGCVLVGDYLADGYINNSRVTFERLMKTMQIAQNNGAVFEIEIK